MVSSVAPFLMSAAILLGAVLLIREPVAQPRPPGGVDVAGAFCITAAMLLLAYCVVRLEDRTTAWSAPSPHSPAGWRC